MERYDDPGQEHIPYLMEEKVYRLESEGYKVRIEHYFREAWNIFKESPGHFVIMILAVAIYQYIGGKILPFWLDWVISISVAPVYLGFGVAAGKVAAGEKVGIADFFAPYDRFMDLAVAYIAVFILVVIGLVMLIIPGIYLAVALSFTTYFIYFGRQDFLEALKYSQRVIHRQWFNFFVFALAMLLLNFLGLLALGIGLIITVPVSMIAFYLAYKDIVDGEAESDAGTL